jgi:small subunit ribosomal protein S15
MLTVRKKKNVISEYRIHETDTGSAAVQVALLSRKIDELATHLKRHPKDNHSRRGLLGMVSKRRKLLKYLENRSPRNYSAIVKKLGLKK